jgi:hypothetical protein
MRRDAVLGAGPGRVLRRVKADAADDRHGSVKSI